MISHSHKFVFVWIMKTGGSSINAALADAGLEQYGAPPKRTRKQKQMINPIKHMRASELIQVPEYKEHWNQYFKFAFVRNPWDLLVSWFHYDRAGFWRFKKYVSKKGWHESKYSFTGCLDRITDENGDVIVDFVGRYENLTEDFQHVCRQIGVSAQLPHVNKSKRGDYRKYYDDKTAEIVAKEFAGDIEFLAISFKVSSGMEKASVLGIGRLGLCFALTLERGRYNVVGSDIRADYVESVNNRKFASYEPNVVEYLAKAKNFRATVSLEKAVEHSNLLFVTVRTESLPNGEYNHSQVEQLLGDLSKIGKVENKNLVICCNVNPGYSDEIQERLQQYGYIVNYNPEWVAQGTILHNQAYPDLVVIGEANKEAGDAIEQVYHNICLNDPIIHRMDRLSAELTKVSLNCYLTTKISYANMIGEIAIRSGVDPAPILAAVGDDSRINPKYFKYGFGFGGPCFPRDTKALVHYAEKVGVPALITKAVMQTNNDHLDFMVAEFISSHEKGEPVVIDSVTFKPGTVIIEESQQLLFAAKLAQTGFKVTLRENLEVIRQVRQIHGDLFKYETRDS